jgi:phage shock protein E
MLIFIPMINFLKTLLGLGGPKLTAEQLAVSTVIDVRTKAEYLTGHVMGSMNIPLQELDASMGKIKAIKTPIVTCCRSGARSGMAAKTLKAVGIDAVNGGTWGAVERLAAES